jgi:hypothetical protein
VTANTIHFNPKKTDYRSFSSGYLFVSDRHCPPIDAICLSTIEKPPVKSPYVTGMIDDELTTSVLQSIAFKMEE